MVTWNDWKTAIGSRLTRAEAESLVTRFFKPRLMEIPGVLALDDGELLTLTRRVLNEVVVHHLSEKCGEEFDAVSMAQTEVLVVLAAWAAQRVSDEGDEDRDKRVWEFLRDSAERSLRRGSERHDLNPVAVPEIAAARVPEASAMATFVSFTERMIEMMAANQERQERMMAANQALLVQSLQSNRTHDPDVLQALSQTKLQLVDDRDDPQAATDEADDDSCRAALELMRRRTKHIDTSQRYLYACWVSEMSPELVLSKWERFTSDFRHLYPEATMERLQLERFVAMLRRRHLAIVYAVANLEPVNIFREVTDYDAIVDEVYALKATCANLSAKFKVAECYWETLKVLRDKERRKKAFALDREQVLRDVAKKFPVVKSQFFRGGRGQPRQVSQSQGYGRGQQQQQPLHTTAATPPPSNAYGKVPPNQISNPNSTAPPRQ
jgi:hypothetical protein